MYTTNTHYAVISTDPTYQQPTRRLTARPDVQLPSEPIIFGILNHLHPMAAGLDLIPAWYIRVLAPPCSGWLARLYSLSLCCSWEPTQWKNAVIQPVPKIKPPLAASDFRPISVVPIRSRIRERMVVTNYIYPAISAPPVVNLVADQFAFRPAGSTTAALIDLLHNITVLLQHNEYVALFSMDFTKAFDSVKHMTLVQKLQLTRPCVQLTG